MFSPDIPKETETEVGEIGVEFYNELSRVYNNAAKKLINIKAPYTVSASLIHGGLFHICKHHFSNIPLNDMKLNASLGFTSELLDYIKKTK